MSNEVWVPVREFEGRYSVSNFGRVRSEMSGKGPRPKPRILADRFTGGYKTVILKKNKTNKCLRVCRLVAQAFIPNPLNKPQVNHKNAIKNDDRVENLEWVTPSENILHAVSLGIRWRTQRKGEECHFSKLNREKAYQIKKRLRETNLTLKEIGKEFGISGEHVGRINRGLFWADD